MDSSKIIYPELSYKLMGMLFAVHNDLGPGYREKHYQRALRKWFIKEKLSFQEQVRVDIDKRDYVGTYYIDFVIDRKIVLEIKATPKLLRSHVLQVIRYLRETNIELGILATFSRDLLIYRRILRGF